MAPQPKRRKPGTGVIRHKPGRDLAWEAAFPIGKDRYRYDYFATRPEAAAYLDRLTAERDHAELPRNVAAGSQRIDAFLQTWIATKRGHVKEKTLAGYVYMVELAIGYFGARRLDSIRREDADMLLIDFAADGFKNVQQLRAVLRQAFQYAADEDYIKRNPFERAKAPMIERKRAAVLSAGEREHMLASAPAEDARYIIKLAPLWHLYSRCGLRKGEGLGLAWADVDLRRATLTVRQQYTNVGSKTERSTPKTRRSQRTIPMPPDLVSMLERHRIEQARFAAAASDWTMSGLIFTNEHGGPVDVWHVQHRWEMLRKASGVNPAVTIHGLRHTCQFLLEQAGTPQSILMALLGHSTVGMARHYSDHAEIEDIRRAMGQ